jgi:hypothetical protein
MGTPCLLGNPVVVARRVHLRHPSRTPLTDMFPISRYQVERIEIENFMPEVDIVIEWSLLDVRRKEASFVLVTESQSLKASA